MPGEVKRTAPRQKCIVAVVGETVKLEFVGVLFFFFFLFPRSQRCPFTDGGAKLCVLWRLWLVRARPTSFAYLRVEKQKRRKN